MGSGRLAARKRRPVGSPSTGCYAARNLARTPPSEGVDTTRAVVRGEAAPPGFRRRDDRRLGEEHVDVGSGPNHLQARPYTTAQTRCKDPIEDPVTVRVPAACNANENIRGRLRVSGP